jgi:N-acetylmuramoyl-L-alanine amidase
MGVLTGRRIVLDPGHGERCEGAVDPGAVNPRLHVNEFDATRRQADLVCKGLQSLGATVEIVENGTEMELNEIGARGKNCDCFVSLHLNACNGDAQGHLVLIDRDGTSADEQLANLINQELNHSMTIPDHGVRRESLGVLRGVPLPAPAVLVESFFLDSASSVGDVEKWLFESAQGITAGVKAFLVPSHA